MSRLQAQAARLTNSAASLQALGGRWWNRPVTRRADWCSAAVLRSGYIGHCTYPRVGEPLSRIIQVRVMANRRPILRQRSGTAGVQKAIGSWTLAAALLLLQSGCSREIGRAFDQTRAHMLVPDKSTLADAIELIGPPLRIRTYLNGNAVARWHYMKDQPVGTEWSVLEIRYSADGRMIAVVKRDGSTPQ